MRVAGEVVKSLALEPVLGEGVAELDVAGVFALEGKPKWDRSKNGNGTGFVHLASPAGMVLFGRLIGGEKAASRCEPHGCEKCRLEKGACPECHWIKANSP